MEQNVNFLRIRRMERILHKYVQCKVSEAIRQKCANTDGPIFTQNTHLRLATHNAILSPCASPTSVNTGEFVCEVNVVCVSQSVTDGVELSFDLVFCASGSPDASEAGYTEAQLANFFIELSSVPFVLTYVSGAGELARSCERVAYACNTENGVTAASSTSRRFPSSRLGQRLPSMPCMDRQTQETVVPDEANGLMSSFFSSSLESVQAERRPVWRVTFPRVVLAEDGALAGSVHLLQISHAPTRYGQLASALVALVVMSTPRVSVRLNTHPRGDHTHAGTCMEGGGAVAAHATTEAGGDSGSTRQAVEPVRRRSTDGETGHTSEACVIHQTHLSDKLVIRDGVPSLSVAVCIDSEVVIHSVHIAVVTQVRGRGSLSIYSRDFFSDELTNCLLAPAESDLPSHLHETLDAAPAAASLLSSSLPESHLSTQADLCQDKPVMLRWLLPVRFEVALLMQCRCRRAGEGGGTCAGNAECNAVVNAHTSPLHGGPDEHTGQHRHSVTSSAHPEQSSHLKLKEVAMLQVGVHESSMQHEQIVKSFPVYAEYSPGRHSFQDRVAGTAPQGAIHNSCVEGVNAEINSVHARVGHGHRNTCGANDKNHTHSSEGSRVSECATSGKQSSECLSRSIRFVHRSLQAHLPHRLLHIVVTSMAICDATKGVVFTYVNEDPCGAADVNTRHHSNPHECGHRVDAASRTRRGTDNAIESASSAGAAFVRLGFTSFHAMDAFTPLRVRRAKRALSHLGEAAVRRGWPVWDANSLTSHSTLPRLRASGDKDACATRPGDHADDEDATDVLMGEWRVQTMVDAPGSDTILLFDRLHGDTLRLAWAPSFSPTSTRQGCAGEDGQREVPHGNSECPNSHGKDGSSHDGCTNNSSSHVDSNDTNTHRSQSKIAECSEELIVTACYPARLPAHRHMRVRRVIEMPDPGSIVTLTAHGELTQTSVKKHRRAPSTPPAHAHELSVHEESAAGQVGREECAAAVGGANCVGNTKESHANAPSHAARHESKTRHQGSVDAAGAAVLLLDKCMYAATWNLRQASEQMPLIVLVAAVHDGDAAAMPHVPESAHHEKHNRGSRSHVAAKEGCGVTGLGVDSIIVRHAHDHHVLYQFTLRSSCCLQTATPANEEGGEMALYRVRGMVPLLPTTSLMTDATIASPATSSSTSSPSAVDENAVRAFLQTAQEYSILLWSRCELNVLSWRHEWSHCTILTLLPGASPAYVAPTIAAASAGYSELSTRNDSNASKSKRNISRGGSQETNARDPAKGLHNGLPPTLPLLLAVCAACPPNLAGNESSLDCPVAFLLIVDGTVYGVWRHATSTKRTKDAITADADMSDDHLQHYVNMECGYRVQRVAYMLNSRLLSTSQVYGHTMHYVDNGCDEVKEVRGVLYVYGIEKASGELLSEAVVLLS